MKPQVSWVRVEESQVPSRHESSPKHVAPTRVSQMGIKGTGHGPELWASDPAEGPQGCHSFLTSSTSEEFSALIWELPLRVSPWLLGFPRREAEGTQW